MRSGIGIGIGIGKYLPFFVYLPEMGGYNYLNNIKRSIGKRQNIYIFQASQCLFT